MDIGLFIEALSSIGISLSSSFLYDFLKSFARRNPNPTIQQFSSELDNFLHLNGVNVSAETVVEMLVANGLMAVQGSYIYAPQRITMGSVAGGSFVFGDNSTSETARTKIVAQGNARIVSTGNAQIVQGEDGSIQFRVGNDNRK